MVEVQKYSFSLLIIFLVVFILLSLSLIVYLVFNKTKRKKNYIKNIDLFSRLTHDLRSPITNIEGYTYLLKENINDIDKVKIYLTKIESSTKYMNFLVNDIFELKKRKNQVGNSRINLKEIYNFCMDNINCYLLSKKIKFVKDVQLTNPWVMGDGLHLTQVLINILMNAIKYTNENGSISFSIKEIEESINLSSYTFKIKDNGCGMSKEFQKKMFIPFMEEHRVKTDVPSSGLGLYIVKQLIEQMQGEIVVESEENKGSCFTIRLMLHHFMNE